MPPSPSSECIPIVSIDTRFRDVEDFQGIHLSLIKCRDLLLYAGVPEEKMDTVHLYVRPDYPLAYSRSERLRMFIKNPLYDTASGRCRSNDEGGVDMTVVYEDDGLENQTLFHEAQHAGDLIGNNKLSLPQRQKLKVAALLAPTAIGQLLATAESQPDYLKGGSSLSLLALGVFAIRRRKISREMEKAADSFMGDKYVKRRFKNVIRVKMDKDHESPYA